MKIQSRFQFELVFTEKYCIEIQKFQILTAKDFENREGGKLVTDTSQSDQITRGEFNLCGSLYFRKFLALCLQDLDNL